MEIKEKLLAWYAVNKRDLPFRSSSNPYHIYISEIMAQQTQIDTMLPYYTRWIALFPTIIDVANASETSILKAWEGLGYYRRARYIHAAAKHIALHWNGHFPTTFRDIASLPGVGTYTAGAISAIAYNLPEVAIDTNVTRVIARLFGIRATSGSKVMFNLVREAMLPLVDEVTNAQLTQAWMELGALVCTAKVAKCTICPLASECYAFKHNAQTLLPITTSKPLPKNEFYDVYLNYDQQSILMSHDDRDGLMLNMYRLPQVASSRQDIPDLKAKHIFSHKVWNMNVFINHHVIAEPQWFYMDISELKKVPIITAHKRIIEKVFKK